MLNLRAACFLFFLGVLFSASGDVLQEQLAAAHRAFQAEKWNEALQLYESVAKENPEMLLAHVRIGDAAVKLRNYPRAITAFQRALNLLPGTPQAERSTYEPTLQAKLGAAYHRNKQLDKADTCFQKAIKTAAERAPVQWYIALGQIETERNNFERARRYYLVAVQLYPDATAAYNNLGHVLLKLNRLDESDAVFREALAQESTLASAAFGRGKIAVKRGQLAAARSFYQRAIQHAPSTPALHKALADVLSELGDTTGAEAAHTRYRRTLAKSYLRQAHQLLKTSEDTTEISTREQTRQALRLLQKAIDADEMFTPALKDYAYIQMQLGKLIAAKQTYQHVLAIESSSRQALLHLGIIEAKLGNNRKAERHFLTLLQHEPDFMETYVRLAQLREFVGELDGAADAFTWGIQHEPTWAPGYWWRGQIRQKQGDAAAAEKDFRRAIELAPEIPFPKHALAFLLADAGRNLGEALRLAEAAVKQDGHPAHRATLAFVYYRLARVSDAQREIEAAFMQAPEHPHILKIHSEILKINQK